MSIQEYWLKIKFYVEAGVGEWGTAVIVLLIALTSFGLGRLSVLAVKAPISVVQVAGAAESIAPGGQFVASKTGETYFYPWCSGAQNLAAEKQVWFKSEEDAQKAGYRPAKNCKGL